MTEIATPRLRLRPARASDVEAMHAVLSNPLAMRWWATPPHETVDQTRAWIEDMAASPPELAEDFIVEFEGRVIGKVGCYRLPDVGYILHPDYWGRGLAFEAMAAVVGHIFATRDLDALTADVDPRNAASLRLLARLGFVESGRAERTWFIAGEWCDSVYLRLERPPGQPRAGDA